MSEQKPSDNKWFIGILITIILSLLHLIISLLSPNIRKWLGLEVVIQDPVISPSVPLTPIPPPIFSPESPVTPQPPKLSPLPSLSPSESPVTPQSPKPQPSPPRITRPSPSPKPQPSPSHSPETFPSPKGKTPVELGQAQYQALVTKAKNTLSYMNPQTLVMFPMGINQPLRLNGTQTQNNFQNLYAIGYADSRKQPQPLTAGDLVELLEQQAGELYYARDKREARFVSFMSEDYNIGQKNVAVIDLIVYNHESQRMYLVPNIQVNSLLKDTLNAINNKTLEVHQLDVRRLSLNHIQNP